MFPPGRIVCLTQETVETLYLLGAEDRIVGISGYVVRPARARREKPKIGGFSSADIDKIVGLAPDLVLAFSDVQADIAAELVRRGVAVHVFNQRTVAGILDMIATVGALVGKAAEAATLTVSLCQGLDAARARAAELPRRPRVFLEEWDEPLISGIGWVSELIGIAGGIDIFPELASHKAARERVVTPEDVVARAPDIILASWCGKKFVPARVAGRPGFAAVPAVQTGALHEIKAPLILAPGPAALTDGLSEIQGLIEAWAKDGALKA